MLTDDEVKAQKTVLRLGIGPGHRLWGQALDAARRGWPAWRIAQAYDLDAKLIHELGGPPPSNR